MIDVIFQARMSSSRLPGKVMMDVHGKPLIDRVISKVGANLGLNRKIVAISKEASDDILFNHLKKKKDILVFRGELDDVYSRFRDCIEHFQCESVMRICCDSPLIDDTIISRAISIFKSSESADLITNIFPKTFPSGMSVEIFRAEKFNQLQTLFDLSASQREHVTRAFYDYSNFFKIENFECDQHFQYDNYAVDTKEDLLSINKRFDQLS